MKEPANRLFSRTPVPGAHDPGGPLGSRRTGGGFGVLPFVSEPGRGAPATDASWAWSVRRFARAAVWLLPAYAVLYGVVAMASDGGVGNDPYPADGQPLYLVGWVASVWLGLLALLALTGLLAATRCRRIALAGLLASIGGMVLMLPFAGLAEQTPVFGLTARGIVLFGATCYSVGWFLTGWSVARSGMFSYGDGTMLMIAAPLLGLGGALIGSLQTFGAIFVLVAGIGIGYRSGRLVPETIARDAATASVAAAPAAPSSPDGPLAAG
ncbi:hypothetical protein O7600_08395 [Micromonospora sp. WMMA1998]|uniref:Uncharacterized protein n=1 Tax=Micromonospora sediminicola TaxID=946078 RepID=A0A1A9B8T3_9ACTN|nr:MULTISPECIES: hypothetical protein [Micromonospora]ATO17459.1 hypothetical protein CO540_29490 [Micromonospora sp. WMMA2032]PGH41105.1 hypothetical protein COO58_28220 [Micromonospora sp. WMMA1996]WBC16839.1 hypothetical protein O7600_08395 [Micromonospora sp. WMMA1998]SBT65548.1 hypothetical protein GA0070622_2546 [Micromonospora sediminicola]